MVVAGNRGLASATSTGGRRDTKSAQPRGRWTDAVSHGELIRAGYDEHLEVDPASARLLIQGVLDKDRAGKKYGDIRWRIGLLETAK